MQYSDYTPPPVPSVVIDGEVVPVSREAVEALAMNAMLLHPHADYRVESGDNGLQGDVGIPDQGHVSEYMDEKFGIESDWIVPGLMTN
jgi:hypothetical protein